MKRHSLTKKAGRRLAAFVLALMVPFAGFTWGQKQDGSEPVGGSVACRLSNGGGMKNGNSGQIEKGDELAALINGKKKVRIVMLLGEATCRNPFVLAEGIGCRGSEHERAMAGAENTANIIPWSDIRAVKVRTSGAGLGALVGFMAGAGLGYWGVTRIHDNHAPASDYLRAMSILGGLGAIGGGLIGALASGWKTVYTAPRGARPAPTFSLAPTRQGGMAFSLSLTF